MAGKDLSKMHALRGSKGSKHAARRAGAHGSACVAASALFVWTRRHAALSIRFQWFVPNSSHACCLTKRVALSHPHTRARHDPILIHVAAQIALRIRHNLVEQISPDLARLLGERAARAQKVAAEVAQRRAANAVL